MFKNALVSVSDKSGLEEFLRPLAEKGMRIVSSGGTARFLKEKGLDVVEVSQQTGFPEVMGGRVKTLHPHIHMPLLQRGAESGDHQVLSEYELEPFDLLVVNLYPFAEGLKSEKTEAEMIELIDIGGPTLLRAGAKNFESVSVVCEPSDYARVLKTGPGSREDRKALAAKVFRHVSNYDNCIQGYLESTQNLQTGKLHKSLRYGENPQQKGDWFSQDERGWHKAEILQGKELSYNNLLDLDASLQCLSLFEAPTVVSVKHNNPCGVASAQEIHTACENSLAADPVSVFGGIIAFNRPLNSACARQLSSLFLECIVAPDIDAEAREILSAKKNLRVLIWKEMLAAMEEQKFHFKSIIGGYLKQSQDEVQNRSQDWKLVCGELTEEQWMGLEFSWKVCSSLKSNAISITSCDQTLGLGMGQVNRVDAVAQAIERSRNFHEGKGPLFLASDAFFPFPDSIEKAAEAGVSAIIQPGGSVKDELVIEKARQLNIPMVFTGRRHFRH